MSNTLSNLVHVNKGVIDNAVGKQSRVEITDKDGKMIQPAEIKKLVEEIQEKYPDSAIVVVGYNKHMPRNLKSGMGELKFQDEEEYYDGKVKDVGGFVEFSMLHITVTKFKK
jgi:hypothetical protein